MFLTPMRDQGFVGSPARLSQAFQLCPRQLEIVSEQRLKPFLRSRVELRRLPIGAEQLGACFAVHYIHYRYCKARPKRGSGNDAGKFDTQMRGGGCHRVLLVSSSSSYAVFVGKESEFLCS